MRAYTAGLYVRQCGEPTQHHENGGVVGAGRRDCSLTHTNTDTHGHSRLLSHSLSTLTLTVTYTLAYSHLHTAH